MFYMFFMGSYSYVLTGYMLHISSFRRDFIFRFFSCGPARILPGPIYSMTCPAKNTYDMNNEELEVGRTEISPQEIGTADTGII